MRLVLPILLAGLVCAPAVQAQPKQPEWAWRQVDLRRVAGLSLVWTQRPGAGQCGTEKDFREELTDRPATLEPSTGHQVVETAPNILSDPTSQLQGHAIGVVAAERRWLVGVASR